MSAARKSLLCILFIINVSVAGAASEPPAAPISGALGTTKKTVALGAHTPASPAQAATPLSTLVREAESHNPEIIAARRAWQAAEQVPSQVSTLPDPVVTAENVSAGTPIPFWDYNKVEMTFQGFGISQEIPYPGKLHLRGEIAARRAASLGKQAQSVVRAVVEQVKATYFRLSYVHEELAILSRDGRLLSQIEKIAEARYAVGQGNQQDVLKAQLEETRLLRDEAQYQQEFAVLEARLKQLLNRSQESADVNPESLTETALPYSSDELLSLVRTGNPEVGAQQEMVRSRGLLVELARKDFYPDFNIGYMWQHTGEPFPDRYALSFGVTIPIYHSRRQQPELAEAAETLSQARREYEGDVQQVYFEVDDQYVSATTDAKILKIYRDGLIPQATATFQAGLSAYQTGKEDFETLLDSFLDILNLDTEYWRTLSHHEIALAKIEQFTGVRMP